MAVVEIYTDGACSGNPGHYAPEMPPWAACGRYGARRIKNAASRLKKPARDS